MIRYEGPKGGPGMQEMLYPTTYLKSMGTGKVVHLLLTDVSPAALPGYPSATFRRKRPTAG